MLRRSRTRLRAWALFALALFVFDALGPAFAALAGVRARCQFVEICTQDGMRRVAEVQAPGDPAESNDECFKCPLCVASGGHACIDASATEFLIEDRGAFAAPTGESHIFSAARYSSSPPARGPPALS